MRNNKKEKRFCVCLVETTELNCMLIFEKRSLVKETFSLIYEIRTSNPKHLKPITHKEKVN